MLRSYDFATLRRSRRRWVYELISARRDPSISQAIRKRMTVYRTTEQFAGGTKNWENARMRPSEALAAHRESVMQIAAACGARNLRVFGSALHGRDREGSDLDLLVDLPPGTSLLRVVGLQQDIEDALGVRVDLCTERELHPALREGILAEARPL